MELFFNSLENLHILLWNGISLGLIIVIGFYLSFRFDWLPLRKLFYGFSLLWNDRNSKEKMSGFVALMESQSATLGVGNIAGVAVAIALGGPGALFWLWLTSFIGMATKFAESVLTVNFRKEDKDGNFSSAGPMYIIKAGLGEKWQWLGLIFCIFGILGSFSAGNLVQNKWNCRCFG